MGNTQFPVQRCQYCGSEDIGLGWQHCRSCGAVLYQRVAEPHRFLPVK